MSDHTRGIYQKYEVTRTDGSSAPGGKHEKCCYFVLDVTHDKFAIPALKAYMEACKGEYPRLADHLRLILDAQPVACGCREAMCPHTPFLGSSPGEALDVLLHLGGGAR